MSICDVLWSSKYFGGKDKHKKEKHLSQIHRINSQIHRKRKKAAAQGGKKGGKVILENGNFREFVLHLAAGSDKGIKKDAGEVAVYHFGIFGYFRQKHLRKLKK